VKSKEEFVKLIEDTIEEISIYTGKMALEMAIERILADISSYNPRLKEIKIDDIQDIDFSCLSEDELKKFYYMFADIVGNLLGNGFKEKLLKRCNGEGCN